MSKIRYGAVLAYITVAFNMISGFLYTPFFISRIGDDAYGVYTLAITFINYFLVDFGLGNSMAKYIAESKEKSDSREASEYFTIIVKLFAGVATVIAVVLIGLYPFLKSFMTGLTHEQFELFRKVYIISGASSVLLFLFIPLDGILTAYEMFVELKTCDLARRVLIIFLSICSLLIDASVIRVVFINMFVGFSISIIKLILVQKKTSVRFIFSYFDMNKAKVVGSFSFWLTVVMLAQRFVIPLAPIILGHFSNASEIAHFSIAITLEGYIYVIASCLNGLFLPRLVHLRNENGYEKINKLFIRVGRIQVVLIGTILSGFIVFGKEFLSLWVGETYLSAYWHFLLIATPDIVIYAQEIAKSLIMIEQKVKAKAITYVLGAIISAITGCILAPRLGGIGTGIGVAICLWGTQVIAMNVVYQKITRLDVKNFFKACFRTYLPYMVSYTLIMYILNLMVTTSSFTILALKITIFCIGGFSILWHKVMNIEEKSTIIRMLRKLSLVKGKG